MSILNLASIQINLRMFLSGFMKIREIVQNKVKEVGLRRKTLGINQIKNELDRLIKQIRLRVQKYIKYKNVKWIKKVLL